MATKPHHGEKRKRYTYRPTITFPVRPRKLTTEVIDVICTHIYTGNHLETAAAMAGVNIKTLRGWVTEGSRIADKYPDGEPTDPAEALLVRLVTGIDYVTASSCANDLKRMEDVGREDWKYWMAKMERRYKQWRPKKEVAKKHKHEGEVAHTHDHRHALEALIALIPPEQINQLIPPGSQLPQR